MKLSVVVPCFNEQEVLSELHRRLTLVCGQYEPYEIILVNDGSRDKTWEIMCRLSAEDPHIVAVSLSHNHGHQLALTAGIDLALGDRVFILDADLQDPPELLPEMMAVMDQGADVAYGQRRTRLGDAPAKRLACAVFYRLLTRLSDTPIQLDTGDFRLVSRRVINIIKRMPERHRFVRGLISWIGFKQQPVLYDRDARFAGTTSYPLRKLFGLAFDGVTAFSAKPLRLASYSGIIFTAFAIGLLGYSLVSWFRGGAPSGWVSLMAAIAILGGVQFTLLGIFGEYLGRLYEQSKGRPLFLIDEIVASRPRADGNPPEGSI